MAEPIPPAAAPAEPAPVAADPPNPKAESEAPEASGAPDAPSQTETKPEEPAETAAEPSGEPAAAPATLASDPAPTTAPKEEPPSAAAAADAAEPPVATAAPVPAPAPDPAPTTAPKEEPPSAVAADAAEAAVAPAAPAPDPAPTAAPKEEPPSGVAADAAEPVAATAAPASDPAPTTAPKEEPPSAAAADAAEPVAATAAPAPDPAPTAAPKEELPAAAADTAEPAAPTAAAPSTPLAQLKSMLPEIIQEAGVEGSVAIWGVPLAAGGGLAQDRVLTKFLDARSGDVTAAAAQLTATLKWRKEFKPEEAATETFPDFFNAIGIILPGRTKDGEPVTINTYGEIKDNVEVFGDLNRFLRWRVGLMERGIALLDFAAPDGGAAAAHQMVQVHDYAGVSLFSRDALSKKAASEASKLFSDYYPELLSKKYFVSVPGWAAFVFKIFAAFLSERTLSKFVVVGPKKQEQRDALSKVMDDSVLPERYGGQAKL